MSHHTATLQSTSATAFDFAYALADRIYWLDDNYIQPFYTWAAPRLRDVAISGLYWGLVALIDVAIWLTDTTLQFMARNAHAIALVAFAQDHPHPELPALAPAAVPLTLALPFALPMVPASDLTADDDADRVIIIYPTVAPFAFKQFLTPSDSIRCWLSAALPLVPSLTLESTPVVSKAVPVLPPVAEVAPIVPKPRKAKSNAEMTDSVKTTGATKTSSRRSPKTKKTATAQ